MKKLIVGNWKMYGTLGAAKAWAAAVRARFPAWPAQVEVAVCPPAPLLGAFDGIPTGDQDCHNAREGAHTGDISALQLADAGCRYVIVGHSERRAQHGETDAQVRAKAAAALDSGLIPIICIGETQEQRDSGKTGEVLTAQIRGCLPADGDFVLAYEPVWAIGSGKLPTPEDIERTHAHIISQCAGLASVQVSVLYGGSVKPGNARDILAIPGVGGLLVGGASLKAEDFCAIIGAA